MKKTLILSLLAVLAAPLTALAAEESTPSALTCADFRPTAEALERYPNLDGACEAVVERDGELFGLFRAVVRRASMRQVTVYIPATNKTVSFEPQENLRVLIDGRKRRVNRLGRGDELRLYLSIRELAEPAIDEIALVSEADLIISHPVAAVAALPTTASLWPTLGAAGIGLVLAGVVLRRRRLAL